jgi:phosphatidylserine/phosphatidylglycerophosphate/cardiolipin synthase-like enzyme
MKFANLKCAALALLLVLTAGCATGPRHAEGGMKEYQPVEPAYDRGHKAARLVTYGAHAGWVYARAVYENPINRPLSHAASLASLVLKSSGGLLRRVALSTVQMPALDGEIPEISHAMPMDLAAFEKKLDTITATRQDTGRIKFLVDGDEYFCRLSEMIQNAEESVDIRTYIFDNDDYAVTLADRLKERSADIRVRVMLDGIGNMQAMQADPDTMPTSHKVPLSMRMYLERDSDVKVRNMTNPWLTGDHTKTTIIDKKVAFVGGMNIGREYRYDWHDMMMEVSGPVVNQLQFESDKAWARGGIFGDFANFVEFLKGKKVHADEGGYPVRILQTRNFDSDIYKAQIAAIQSAQSYILIENAYFSDDRTVYELGRARRRGVDVHLIIPFEGNHGPLNASNRVTVNKLLELGIRVHAFPGMTHIKAAIYDGWASMGSANFDKLSLKVNKELNLATSDPETVNALMEQVFIPDMLMSREIMSPFETTVMTHLAEIMVDELL